MSSDKSAAVVTENQNLDNDGFQSNAASLGEWQKGVKRRTTLSACPALKKKHADSEESRERDDQGEITNRVNRLAKRRSRDDEEEFMEDRVSRLTLTERRRCSETPVAEANRHVKTESKKKEEVVWFENESRPEIVNRIERMQVSGNSQDWALKGFEARAKPMQETSAKLDDHGKKHPAQEDEATALLPAADFGTEDPTNNVNAECRAGRKEVSEPGEQARDVELVGAMLNQAFNGRRSRTEGHEFKEDELVGAMLNQAFNGRRSCTEGHEFKEDELVGAMLNQEFNGRRSGTEGDEFKEVVSRVAEEMTSLTYDVANVANQKARGVSRVAKEKTSLTDDVAGVANQKARGKRAPLKDGEETKELDDEVEGLLTSCWVEMGDGGGGGAAADVMEVGQMNQPPSSSLSSPGVDTVASPGSSHMIHEVEPDLFNNTDTVLQSAASDSVQMADDTEPDLFNDTGTADLSHTSSAPDSAHMAGDTEPDVFNNTVDLSHPSGSLNSPCMSVDAKPDSQNGIDTDHPPHRSAASDSADISNNAESDLFNTTDNIPQSQPSVLCNAINTTTGVVPQSQPSVLCNAINSTTGTVPQSQPSVLCNAINSTTGTVPQSQPSVLCNAINSTTGTVPQSQPSVLCNTINSTTGTVPQSQPSVLCNAINSTTGTVPQSQPSALHITANTTQPETAELPDLVAVARKTEKNPFNLSQDIYCFSSPSQNFAEICQSPDNCHCPKRSPLVFQDLVADVGGCLCTRTTERAGRGAAQSSIGERTSMLPDLVMSSAHSE